MYINTGVDFNYNYFLKMEPVKKYNLQGKGFFLTYPKCDSTKEELVEHLRSKGPMEKFIVC